MITFRLVEGRRALNTAQRDEPNRKNCHKCVTGSIRGPKGMNAEGVEEVGAKVEDRLEKVGAGLSVESLFVSAIFGEDCERVLCREGAKFKFGVEFVAVEDGGRTGSGGNSPVTHNSRKYEIPGTSSSRSLMEVAIWNRDDVSAGDLLKFIGAEVILLLLRRLMIEMYSTLGSSVRVAVLY